MEKKEKKYLLNTIKDILNILRLESDSGQWMVDLRSNEGHFESSALDANDKIRGLNLHCDEFNRDNKRSKDFLQFLNLINTLIQYDLSIYTISEFQGIIKGLKLSLEIIQGD